VVLSRVRLPLAFDPAPLQADLDRLEDDEWVAHFNTAIYEGDWSGIALRSVGGKPAQLYPDPMAQGAFADTEVLVRCPALAAAVAHFECDLLAVRLLRLGPGARIGEHRDYRLGHADGEIRIHVPVTDSPDVEFLVDGDPVEMGAGEAWYLDLNLPHSVTNHGGDARVNLVVDCVVNPWLDRMLGAA
jgi:hypothetical protein